MRNVYKTLLFIAVCLLMCCADNVFGQKKDSMGNYLAIKIQPIPTGKTFTDSKGIVYPIMKSKNNKLFYVKTSKTGKNYNVYIKEI
jgi:hypothetical protein